jgi:Protein of unknown function (DUF3047)
MRYPWTWYLGVMLWGIWGCWASLAWGQTTVLVDFSFTQETVPKGWELSVNAGEAQLQLVQDDGKQALRMRSDKASFSLQKKIHIPLQTSPFLVWDWKVTELPKGGDFRRSGTDDQAAQLIIAFSSSQFLSYVWDTTAPKGLIASASAPLFKKIFAVVMQSGTQGLGTWISERRNLIDDYKQAYGEAPEAIEGVRIQINSQHTESRAESYWHSISVTAKP